MSRNLKEDAQMAKDRGNACLSAKDYDGAIKEYTQVRHFVIVK